MVNVSIITIGDELLIGQVIDSNSAWIAQELNKVGIGVKRRVAVGDNKKAIWNAIDNEFLVADVLLLTGGLGPTADDITKPLLCEYFEGKLVRDEAAYRNVEYLFKEVFKRDFTDRNKKQADVPDNCTVLQNKRGTAPGMLFRKHGKILVSMPGVPHEMQGMITDDVIPLLLSTFQPGTIQHRTLLTFGIGESMLADLIQDFEEQLPANIKLAYLPNFGMVRLRLTETIEQEEVSVVDERFKRLQMLVKDYLVSNEDEPMEVVLGKLLQAAGKTISTAESCTGGLIAHMLSAKPGSSAFLKGGIVSYANDVKTGILNVNTADFNQYGAVSETTVLQMLRGVLAKLDSDYAIAVSGIMGPDGGSADKPVGTVWIANALNMARQFIVDGN
ncbi:MAG: CinA family nicotinamide mononucleotide deamidase-related protein [Chitinophagaceae bacterium]|nr:MAG: CinA family nicotinamide mononucleotide deamidase-related protein [Chitinophagaceae bacterium]